MLLGFGSGSFVRCGAPRFVRAAKVTVRDGSEMAVLRRRVLRGVGRLSRAVAVVSLSDARMNRAGAWRWRPEKREALIRNRFSSELSSDCCEITASKRRRRVC